MTYSKKHAHIKARVQTPYPTYDQNGPPLAEIDTLFMTKTVKNHTLWAAHTHKTHIREYPHPYRSEVASRKIEGLHKSMVYGG